MFNHISEVYYYGIYFISIVPTLYSRETEAFLVSLLSLVYISDDDASRCHVYFVLHTFVGVRRGRRTAGRTHILYIGTRICTLQGFWRCAARLSRGLSDEPIETVDPGLNVCCAVNEA